MTPTERDELQRDAVSLAYWTIRLTGLWRELSNEQWDVLAKQLGERALSVIVAGVEETEARLQVERDKQAEMTLAATLETERS